MVELIFHGNLILEKSNDLIGSQVVASLKNIYAIICGIMSGYSKYNPNSKYTGKSIESSIMVVFITEMQEILKKIHEMLSLVIVDNVYSWS